MPLQRASGREQERAPAPTTYSEITGRCDVEVPGAAIGAQHGDEIRPEVRYDRSLNGTTPYGDGRHVDQWTFAADVVLGF